MTAHLVEARGVNVDYRRSRGWNPVLSAVDLSISRGEIVGLAGESGSGKSTLGSLLLGERPPGRRLSSGRVLFEGADIFKQSFRKTRSLHGLRIAFLPQNVGASLTPTLRVAGHLAEALKRRHPNLGAADVVRQSAALLGDVGIPDANAALRRFPHQFSGGQQQRIMLALALAAEPDLLILDEPTTGQDAVTRRAIVELLRRFVERGKTTVLFISHDLATLSELCDRVAVMHAGRIVEIGPTRDMLHTPAHVYTRSLVAALPRIDVRPSSYAEKGAVQADVLFGVDTLNHTYGHAQRPALDAVSLTVRTGETLALIGESGSGKSTLLRIAAGLVRPSGGILSFDGRFLAPDPDGRAVEERRRIQIVFQNPDRSLNPHHRIGFSLKRVLKFYFGLGGSALDAEVTRLLDIVRLPSAYAERYPAELSGGERQRVAIARALAARPSLLLCDEVVSALDVSVQSAVLDLLQDLRSEIGLSLLFVTHDVAAVRWFADRVTVLYRGVVVEEGPVTILDGGVNHAYTRQLLAAVPRLRASGLPDVSPDIPVPDSAVPWTPVGPDHFIRAEKSEGLS